MLNAPPAAALYRASGFVLWPEREVLACPLLRRFRSMRGRNADIPEIDVIDPMYDADGEDVGR